VSEAIDITSKVLTLLVLLLAGVFVAWQCFEGLARLTTMGAEFRHFIINRRAFERWNRELDPVCGVCGQPGAWPQAVGPRCAEHMATTPGEPLSYDSATEQERAEIIDATTSQRSK
jgi:hypothetical protein